MRKTLALVLSIVMVLSLAVVGVSAADATLINSVEDFKKIATDETTLGGSYKLAADITLADGDVIGGTFTGSLDGNGHTITVNATGGIFATLKNAKISNLTIAGEIKATGNVGALANSANSEFAITNVTNRANVSSTKDSAYVGGLIGSVSAGSNAAGAGSATNLVRNAFVGCVNYGKIHAGAEKPRIGGIVGNSAKCAYSTFTNCVNYGEIDVSQDEGFTAVAASPYLGGISSDIFAGEFINCLNKGNLTCSAVGAHIGGIVGRFIPSCQMEDQSCLVKNCTNEGNVTAKGGGIGGICGQAGVKVADPMKKAVFTFEKCVNKGNVTSLTNGNVGGILGYAYGSGAKEYATLTDCVNYGTIASKELNSDGVGAYISQFLGYTNSESTVIKNCVGSGKLETKDTARAVIIGLSSCYSINYPIADNKIVENSGVVNFSYADDEAANGRNRIAFADRPDGMVSEVSAADAAAAIQALGTIGYQAPANPAGPTPATGDAMIWVAVVALVSVLGMGAAVKARNN